MYLIKVWTYHPYEIQRNYRVEGSSFSVAISRAVKLFRKEDRLKGKKYDNIHVGAKKI